MRIRLTFSKTDAMRYTAHMDLHRSLERTLRRARLPLTHSQGYTRRPKIQIASALPLGVTGERELADVWLDEMFAVDELLERIHAAAPPGIRVHAVEEIAQAEPKLQNVTSASDFIASLLDPLPALERCIQELLAAESLPRTRRDKAYDLRPLVLALERTTDDVEGRQQLAMTLRTKNGATGRPDEVVAALGGDPLGVRVHRLRIYLGPRQKHRENLPGQGG